MTGILLDSLEQDGLKGDVHAGDDLIVRFAGVMREENTNALLADFLDRVFDHASERNKLILDISALSYMNATAFRVFIPWLHKLGDRQEPCRVKIEYDTTVMWQNVTVSTLKSIAGRLIL